MRMAMSQPSSANPISFVNSQVVSQGDLAQVVCGSQHVNRIPFGPELFMAPDPRGPRNTSAAFPGNCLRSAAGSPICAVLVISSCSRMRHWATMTGIIVQDVNAVAANSSRSKPGAGHHSRAGVLNCDSSGLRGEALRRVRHKSTRGVAPTVYDSPSPSKIACSCGM